MIPFFENRDNQQFLLFIVQEIFDVLVKGKRQSVLESVMVGV